MKMVNLRKLVFWILDATLGLRRISKFYKEVQVDEPHMRERNLEDILKYAVAHVPFYKGKNYERLEDFPVMSKLIFKAEGANCISDEFPNYERLRKAKTSGSTGTPLVVYLDPRKRHRVIADLLVVNDKIGWYLGCRYAFIRNWKSKRRPSCLAQFAKNFKPVNVSDFDSVGKETLFNFFKDHSQTILIGYSTAICDFMDWIVSTGRDGRSLRLRLIVCSAEDLTENKRRKLRDTFGCPVCNRYSNEENGLIAMMEDGSNSFRVNTASVRVEILNRSSSDRVCPGEMGRVVVTDLFNRAMPLIRYDTGDLAISLDPSDNVKTIIQLCGRSADVLCTPSGILVSNTTIAAVSETVTSIVKCQLAQVSGKKFVFRYVGELSQGECLDLEVRLLSVLGPDVELVLSNQEDIPVAENGKFRPLVREFDFIA